jgi:hypothetical protein
VVDAEVVLDPAVLPVAEAVFVEFDVAVAPLLGRVARLGFVLACDWVSEPEL